MKTAYLHRFESTGRLVVRAAICAIYVVSLTACSSVFFYPQEKLVATPKSFNLEYQDIWFQSADGVKLHAWHVPAKGTKRGTIVHFHGNAENMSTHFFSVYWLPQHGYDVLTFDYRGFGSSEGNARFPGVLDDGLAVLELAESFVTPDSPCLFIFGQSIGGVIALLALDQVRPTPQVTALILDSAFSDFLQIIRESIPQHWLMAPVRPLLPLFVPDVAKPVRAIARLGGLPVLIFHGSDDAVVRYHHAEALYRAAREPKQLWEVPMGQHIDGVSRPGLRAELLRFLDETCRTRAIPVSAPSESFVEPPLNQAMALE